jgi:dTDP-4-dehydrorhamnose reductase
MINVPSILITGGSGLLGANWFYTMRNDYTIYLGINKKYINPEGGKVISIDFSSTNAFFNQVVSIKPTLIINTAGLTSVENCENNPDLAFHINVELSTMVADVAKKLSIPFVHISTDHLFEGNASMLSENEATCAINVYGYTKALAEKAVLDINPDALVIRTNFYAWGTSYRKSFSDQIIKSLRDKQMINLFDDVYYTPILAENLINTVHDLLKKKAVGIFNVVSDDRISKYDFGVLLAEQFALDKSYIKRCSLQSNTNLVRRPTDMSLSNQKTRELLGRKLGTVKNDIFRLHQQEVEGKITEIQLL